MQALATGRQPQEGELQAWRGAEKVSLSDVLQRAQPSLEFAWRRKLEGLVAQRRR
jgi:hypothetical protein